MTSTTTTRNDFKVVEAQLRTLRYFTINNQIRQYFSDKRVGWLCIAASQTYKARTLKRLHDDIKRLSLPIIVQDLNMDRKFKILIEL